MNVEELKDFETKVILVILSNGRKWTPADHYKERGLLQVIDYNASSKSVLAALEVIPIPLVPAKVWVPIQGLDFVSSFPLTVNVGDVYEFQLETAIPFGGSNKPGGKTVNPGDKLRVIELQDGIPPSPCAKTQHNWLCEGPEGFFSVWSTLSWLIDLGYIKPITRGEGRI